MRFFMIKLKLNHLWLDVSTKIKEKKLLLECNQMQSNNEMYLKIKFIHNVTCIHIRCRFIEFIIALSINSIIAASELDPNIISVLNFARVGSGTYTE